MWLCVGVCGQMYISVCGWSVIKATIKVLELRDSAVKPIACTAVVSSVLHRDKAAFTAGSQYPEGKSASSFLFFLWETTPTKYDSLE